MEKNRRHGWAKFCRFPLIVALLLIFSLVSALGAAADSGLATYQWASIGSCGKS